MPDEMKLKIVIDESSVSGLDKTFKKYETMFKDLFSGTAGGMSKGMTAAAGAAPELVVLIAAILVVVTIIQKVIELVLGAISKLVDAILGPVLDVFNMILDIMLVPFKILGTFLMTLIIPYFRIATRLSSIMIAFFGTFMDKYEQSLAGRMTGTGGYAKAEGPMAAEAGAAAEALTYMFGGIFVGLQTAFQLIMIGMTEALLTGFADVISVLPGVGDALVGFKDMIYNNARTAEAGVLLGASAQMQVVSALAKGVGDVAVIMAGSTDAFWKNLIGTSASIEEENAALEGSVAAFEDMVKTHVDTTTPQLNVLSETLTNAGIVLSLSTATTAGAIDSLYNAITRAEGGSNLIQALKNLATNANLAAEKVGLLAIAAGGAKTALEGIKGGSSGSMENTIVNLMGNMGNINLGTGSQVINLGR